MKLKELNEIRDARKTLYISYLNIKNEAETPKDEVIKDLLFTAAEILGNILTLETL